MDLSWLPETGSKGKVGKLAGTGKIIVQQFVKTTIF
jgi:hypothetical protein